MSLKLKFNSTKHLLDVALVLAKEAQGNSKENRIQAQCFDVLRIILTSIKESAMRLEEKLVNYSSKYFEPAKMPTNNLDWTNKKSQISDSISILSDIWGVIDNVHRMSEILKRIKNVSVPPSFISMSSEVKDIRDSFHHIDERVKEYFSDEACQDSVFGNIFWRYRLNTDEKPTTFYLVTGITFEHIGLPPQDGMWDCPSIFDKESGAFDLNIMYVTKNGDKKNYVHERHTLSIDNIIEQVNMMITQLTRFSNLKVTQWHKEFNSENGLVLSGCTWPMSFRFFSKEDKNLYFDVIPTILK